MALAIQLVDPELVLRWAIIALNMTEEELSISIPSLTRRIVVSISGDCINTDCKLTNWLTDVAVHVTLEVHPNQASTRGSVNYILIGDMGQTREAELHRSVHPRFEVSQIQMTFLPLLAD